MPNAYNNCDWNGLIFLHKTSECSKLLDEILDKIGDLGRREITFWKAYLLCPYTFTGNKHFQSC